MNYLKVTLWGRVTPEEIGSAMRESSLPTPDVFGGARGNLAHACWLLPFSPLDPDGCLRVAMQATSIRELFCNAKISVFRRGMPFQDYPEISGPLPSAVLEIVR